MDAGLKFALFYTKICDISIKISIHSLSIFIDILHISIVYYEKVSRLNDMVKRLITLLVEKSLKVAPTFQKRIYAYIYLQPNRTVTDSL